MCLKGYLLGCFGGPNSSFLPLDKRQIFLWSALLKFPRPVSERGPCLRQLPTADAVLRDVEASRYILPRGQFRPIFDWKWSKRQIASAWLRISSQIPKTSRFGSCHLVRPSLAIYFNLEAFLARKHIKETTAILHKKRVLGRRARWRCWGGG